MRKSGSFADVAKFIARTRATGTVSWPDAAPPNSLTVVRGAVVLPRTRGARNSLRIRMHEASKTGEHTEFCTGASAHPPRRALGAADIDELVDLSWTIHELLDISETISGTELRQVYRRRVRQLHPDLQRAQSENERSRRARQLALVTRAYAAHTP